ncbi:MAG TPA: EFR1 family ferrodoxin, partial [Clostridia bacterium]|nr:EFR1 family ferrodoxin [Clostridia bacterium]
IHERGGKLSAGFAVRMPGNYIASYGAFPQRLQKLLFKRSKRKVLAITTEIVMKKVKRIPRGSVLMRASQTASHKILDSFGEKARNFRVNGKCIGCAICCRICPDGNIKINEGKPIWGSICEQCMACIQWCPYKSIEYSDKTEKRSRYRHPEVNVTDIVSKRS